MTEKEINDIVDGLLNKVSTPKIFINKIEEADIDIIYRVIANLSATGDAAHQYNALREACNAIIQDKINAKLLLTFLKLDKSIKKLNKSTTILSIVGIVVSIIGVTQIFK